MKIKPLREHEVLREALQILSERMEPAKVGIFLSALNIGEGDYLAWRDKEFAGETVDSLAKKIKAFQEAKEREKPSDRA